MIKNIEKLSLTHYVGRFNIHKADNCPPGFFSVQAVYLFDMQPFLKTQKQYWVKKVKKKKLIQNLKLTEVRCAQIILFLFYIQKLNYSFNIFLL